MPSTDNSIQHSLVHLQVPPPLGSSSNGTAYGAVPEELRALPQWVVYKLVPKPGKPGKMDKPPFNARTGEAASSTDSDTWSTFEEAVHAASLRVEYHGIGFVFSKDDPYAGVDLDDCRNAETGEIALWAREFLAILDGYAEVSPSGTGVHIIVRGSVPPAGHRRPYEGGEVEMYDWGRFFTVTGVAL